jgi:hypothetical protein
MRGDDDLKFEILLRGEIGNGEDSYSAQEMLRKSIPRSEWIENLRRAEYMDILLLEVPFPAMDAPETLTSVRHHLEVAQRHFTHAEYTSCVGSCRTAIQELGHHVYETDEWSKGAIPKTTDNMRDMSKDERIKGMFAMLRHLTNQAHHGEGEGGVIHYSRIESRMVLQMTVSAVTGVIGL